MKPETRFSEEASYRGEVGAATDLETLAQLLSAVLLERSVVLARPIDRAFLERLVDALLGATDSRQAPNSSKASTNDEGDGHPLRDLFWL